MKRAIIDAIVAAALACAAILAGTWSGDVSAQTLVNLHQGLVGVQLGFGDEVGGVSEFRTVENSDVPTLAVFLDVSAPPFSIFGYPHDSSLAIGSGFAEVLHVFSFRRRTQVIPSVVAANGVFMVDLMRWKDSSHVEPCQTVGSVRPAIDHNFNISLASYGAGCLSHLVTGSSDAPSEQAGGRVVMQQLAKAFCGDNWSIHDATPVRFGQKPASVERAARASTSYGINLVTAHTSGGYRTFTPGIYATSGPWSAGVLRNSEGSWGAHATHAWRAGDVLGRPVQVSAGLITGYRRAPVLPFAAVSMPIAHGRLIAIPGPRCVAIHYAYEIR